NNGYALMETLFYIALFSILSILIINSMIVMMGSFKETAIQAELRQGADILKKMTQEIRSAHRIDEISTNALKIGTLDEDNNERDVDFLLSGTDVRFLESDDFIANLNSQNLEVTNLSFTEINTTNSVAIKISVSVRSKRDKQNRVVDFYDTVVLRGSYWY
ncbi:MAG: hypothetical protein AAB873_01240, partial [Patescibacteria group bacterium]